MDNAADLAGSIPVVIVGGGQAGLSVSWHLSQSGIDHVVLERDELMHAWRDARWDSFSLVTPNWQCRLPGYFYAGDDPDGFMVKDELVDWLDGWLRTFAPPVREHTAVTSVRAHPSGGYEVATSAGSYLAEQVVVATGGYHLPAIPRVAERLPDQVRQLHSSRYKNDGQLPDGAVLVVGTGQSGAQIAEDLHLAGRAVHLAVGSAPRVARRHRGRDVVAWLQDMGHYAKPITDQPPEERYRDRTNHYVTGRDGGHDIDLRVFAQQGMTLHGRLEHITGGRICFGDDLGRRLDAADAVYTGINSAIDDWIDARGLDVEPGVAYEPPWEPAEGVSELDVSELAAVIWATGFHNDYRWLHVPTFDGAGHPAHLRGVSPVPGLHFIGLPWLNTWGSGRFAAVAADAAHLAEQVRAQRRDPVLTIAS